MTDLKTYKIAYAWYPFDVVRIVPEMEDVKARNLEEAFDKIKEKYGNKVEIFKSSARKFYNEPEID